MLLRYYDVYKNYAIALLMMFASCKIWAQNEVSFSHYWTMEPSFNPATVGKEAKLNVVAAYAIQMAGFEHNPHTMYAAADMPFYALGASHGVGIQFLNDARKQCFHLVVIKLTGTRIPVASSAVFITQFTNVGL